MITIPLQIDDMPLSPEAFRVYFAIVRSLSEHQEFPPIERITSRCFGRKYALGSTHTNLALTELTTWNLIKGTPGNFEITQPSDWKNPGGAT